MKSKFKLIIVYICINLIGCSNNDSKNNSSNSNSEYTYIPNKENNSNQTHEIEYNSNENADDTNEETTIENGCKYEDGIYSAIVNYTNLETGFANTYTLDVEVEDCEVIQINFPNGGWLDNDHITPAELDNYGTCTIYGEDGKTYDIELE